MPRIVRSLLIAVALVAATTVIVSGLWFLSSTARGLWRGILAAGIGLAIAVFGVGFFRQFAPSTQPDETPEEVPARFGLGYLCEVCGLELSVIKVARPEPPKHCGEAMAVIQRPAD